MVPVDHLQVVCDGLVVRDVEMNRAHDGADGEGSFPVSHSGWCLLRAWSDRSEYPILDLYPYATTSPVYLNVDGPAARSSEDAEYFISWIDRLRQGAEASADWNTSEEKSHVFQLLTQARAVYEKLQKP
jgi:TolB protein